MSERCADCLDLVDEDWRFAVLKVDTSRQFSKEEQQLGGDIYEAIICGHCAGWYGDEAIDATEAA